MRRVIGTVFCAVTMLVGTASASAAQPVACIGFPNTPQAYVCLDTLTPQNAVPGVVVGPGQTLVVPLFCAIQCVGPTPVPLPAAGVAQGEGTVATIVYNGSTYGVPVPQVPLMTFSASIHSDCYGCGDTYNALTGTFTGVINGHSYSAAALSGSLLFGGTVNPRECMVTLSLPVDGTLTVSDGTRSDSANVVGTPLGDLMVFTFVSGSFTGYAVATYIDSGVLPPGGCYGTADKVVAGAGLVV